MGQKVSSSPRVRTNYAGPISHHQVVHDPSYPDSGLGENSHSPSSLHNLAMGSGTSQANGHQPYHQRGSYPSTTSSTSYAASAPVQTSQQHSRNRARSLGNCTQNDGASSSSSRGLHIPGMIDLNLGQDSDDSSPEDNGSLPLTRSRGRTFPFHAQSLPAHLFTSTLFQHVQHVQGIKCPVCSKSVPSDDVECHLVICLTKPRVVYNATLTERTRDHAVDRQTIHMAGSNNKVADALYLG
ncbi:E3 ubiquitin-protein ligase znrf2-like isoform X2 [Acanthaster planci]|uniref:RING-type E3 ubiquitin transferase n=1 Tax=Acanthaster planci TaxID=133434 RepID=A0A8B7YKB1_ACAPL|nr:E3 ubiquitin-protein ligase znrf2-like isoform X2 [Acanthaster planci]